MEQDMYTAIVESKFTDQFFVATEGRNDKRREMIVSLWEKLCKNYCEDCRMPYEPCSCKCHFSK